MKNGKLFQLIRTLSMAERQQFRDFLHSPFHNKREDCLRLWAALEGMKEGRLPEKERLFQESYPKSSYDDQRFRLLQSTLLGLLESFLVLQEFGQNELEQDLLLIRAYRKRGLKKHLRGARRRVEQHLENLKTADAQRVRHEMELEVFQLEAQNRVGNLSYQPMIDRWDEYYLAIMIQQACSAKAYEAVANTTYDYGLLEVLLDRVDWERYMSLPVISLYYHGYWMLVRPEEEAHFASFKRSLLQHGDSFPLVDRRDLFVLGANYCARRYNEGRTDYARESNEIYKAGLACGAFLVQGQFNRFTFRNIVVIALVVGDFGWAEQFMEDYQAYLSPRYRESTLSLTRALLEYQRQNYGRALELLQKSEYSDLVLNLSAKAVLIKIYYETGEHDLLDAHLAAMRIFIRRQKNPSYHEVNFRQLVYFAQRLLELNPYDPGGKARLREEVAMAKAVAEKDWLLRMLERRGA
jgi:hypothetical protein